MICLILKMSAALIGILGGLFPGERLLTTDSQQSSQLMKKDKWKGGKIKYRV